MEHQQGHLPERFVACAFYKLNVFLFFSGMFLPNTDNFLRQGLKVESDI